MGQGEQKNSGKEEAHSFPVLSQTQKKEDVIAPLKKVPSHVVNIDNNGLIKVIRVNMGLELMGQSVYYYYRPLCDVFGDKRLWVLVG